ncbi:MULTISPECIES: peptidoglycan D,D-transpeptidase FtsI family protein [Nitrosomonas]|uniref:Peptidoglycan D,D-transpeptidase FtsI n=2 Tax=Nitrosomonas eutropha TaxID=916 RepID=A0ABX5MAT8_9PROT|nr:MULTISPECIES: penicillin-binding protein 2 [Nitrosomonas]ABI58536.1 peptidoglycan synthetase FtsI [Nitrosomonas eutropha C91]MXS80971.1 penicillin-binding protein 2 [Nitrosomonas sp. GH22]PXV82331.1 peptidoglycan synthetase FtsI [Nitrosomonas eutropha]SCX13487.1 peptidoglycan synthetase FtsI [Nitrosomonas eutropha]SDW14560.1 peptidoglycan synthetase FtsI [Nitrosomonas eutropha]
MKVLFNPSRKTISPVPEWRSRLVQGLLLTCLIILISRSIYLQALNKDFLQQQGQSRHERVIEQNMQRGNIKDRNGEILAVSAPVRSVWIEPQRVNATPEQIRQLASLTGVEEAVIQQRIRSGKKFVYLRRQLPPELAEKVAELNIKGVNLKHEFYRYYPARELAAHILGFTDIDGRGQEGMELAWQDMLTGEDGKRRVIKDRIGRIVEDVEQIQSPKPGQDVVLSIDSKIQYLAYRELARAVKEQHAKAGSIVALDVQTGEVLAMANYPAFNPNQRASMNNEVIRNRVLVDTFEPGSTLKPFVVAVAMETGRIKPDTLMETAGGKLKIGRAVIHDVRDKGNLTVSQVIQASSNVGAAKIALLLPPKTFWEMLNRSGFGTETGIGFPGEASGRLRAYNTWRPIEQATMSYGHGISASLMQLARAYTLFATDGELKPVTLLKRDMPAVGQKVISHETAQSVRKMLELAVQPEGTGNSARISGYRVAGKTGTAHKRLKGQKGYAKDRYISSFVGFAPASDPRVIIAIMIDEPSSGNYYGGTVAAPVFSRVMEGTLRILNVPFDEPLGNLVISPVPAELEDKG